MTNEVPSENSTPNPQNIDQNTENSDPNILKKEISTEPIKRTIAYVPNPPHSPIKRSNRNFTPNVAVSPIPFRRHSVVTTRSFKENKVSNEVPFGDFDEPNESLQLQPYDSEIRRASVDGAFTDREGNIRSPSKKIAPKSKIEPLPEALNRKISSIKKNSIPVINLQAPNFKFEDAIPITCYRTTNKSKKLNIQADWQDREMHEETGAESSDNDQIYVASNLGHSGSGYTVGYGTVDFTVNNFIERLKNDEKLRDYITQRGISIVGAGIIGTMTALLLDEQINNNPEIKKLFSKKIDLKIYYNEDKNLPSYHAGGLLAVTKLEGQTEEEIKQLKDYTLKTDEFFRNIKNGANNIFNIPQDCIEEPLVCFGPNTDQGMQFYKDANLTTPEQSIINFENTTIDNINCYKNGLFIQTHKFMNSIKNEAHRRGVNFIEKTVTKLTNLNEGAVFDCSGSGRINGYDKDVTGDEKYLHDDAAPIVGHMLLAKVKQKINYVFVTEVTIQDPQGKTFNQRIQIMPKETEMGTNCMIGGTFIDCKNLDQNLPHHKEPHKFVYNVAQIVLGNEIEMQSEEFKNYKFISFNYIKRITNNNNLTTTEIVNTR